LIQILLHLANSVLLYWMVRGNVHYGLRDLLLELNDWLFLPHVSWLKGYITLDKSRTLTLCRATCELLLHPTALRLPLGNRWSGDRFCNAL